MPAATLPDYLHTSGSPMLENPDRVVPLKDTHRCVRASALSSSSENTDCIKVPAEFEIGLLIIINLTVDQHKIELEL